jgi:hypothetical protein
MKPDRLPIARELFEQWRINRARRTDAASRPFSRHWERLLEDAGLDDATGRDEAERDVRVLAGEGWIELRPVRYRPHLIDRIVIPFEAEERWRMAFGYQPADDAELQRIADHPWTPALSFIRTARIGIPLEDLLRLDAFLAADPASRPMVPIKERSLAIFGDEKRLDGLVGSALFQEGRLTLEQLRCRIVPEPLGWRRGMDPAGPVLVLENLATWDTHVAVDRMTPRYSAVVYGGGNRFVEGVAFLAEIFREIGAKRRVLYFGDLDTSGLRIPMRASRTATRLGLPPVEPDLESYARLLRTAERFPPTASGEDPVSREDVEWLGPLADEAMRVLGAGGRLAQERVGMEQLMG